MCSTYVPIIVQETEADVEDVDEIEEDKETNNFTVSDKSPKAQPQLAPSAPSLYLGSLPEHKRRQMESSSCSDPDVVRRLSDQTKSCHYKGVSTTASNIDKVLASNNLDQFYEAAGFVFNR